MLMPPVVLTSQSLKSAHNTSGLVLHYVKDALPVCINPESGVPGPEWYRLVRSSGVRHLGVKLTRIMSSGTHI